MRTYGQYCSVAKALDVVGDRWTLLIIRELVGHSVLRRSEIAASAGFPDQAKKFPDGPN